MMGFLLLAAGICLSLFSAYLNNTILMTVSVFLLLLSAAGFFFTLLSLIFLRIQPLAYRGRAVRGLSGAAHVQLSSRISPTLAPYIILKYDVSLNGKRQRRRVRVPVRTGAVLELPFEATECGLLKIPALTVRVTDLFGWFSLWKSCRVSLVLPVFPENNVKTAVPSAGGLAAEEGRKKITVPLGSEVRDLSAYAAGDEARAIHWPASARLGKLMKRDYEEGARRIADYEPTLPKGPAEVDAAAGRISADICALLDSGCAVRLPGQEAIIGGQADLDAWLTEMYTETEAAQERKKGGAS